MHLGADTVPVLLAHLDIPSHYANVFATEGYLTISDLVNHPPTLSQLKMKIKFPFIYIKSLQQALHLTNNQLRLVTMFFFSLRLFLSND